VRARPAKIDEHAIAHEFGDVPLEASNLTRDRVLVGPDNLPHVFGIKAAGERRRADEVDEHDGELAAFCLAGCRAAGITRPLRLVRANGSDRFQQLLARAERQAELLQVALGEFREQRPVDLVVAEGGLVAAKALLPQRCRDVHGDPSLAIIARRRIPQI
jgi:hypothetical protein